MSRNIIKFKNKPSIIGSASVTGKMESEGPLNRFFDLCSGDSKFNMDTWEKAEAEMVRECAEIAIKKSNLKHEDIDLSFAGDLTNQCAASTFGMKDKKIPYIGLYGACSTFALSLGMAALSVDSGVCNIALGEASSHFCSAERQYRFPLEYGCQRPPSAQNTVTGAGCAILSKHTGSHPSVIEFLPGIVKDFGVTDANNMGAAMAPSCADTVIRYFSLSDLSPDDFDLVLTGDLGYEGHNIFLSLIKDAGIDLENNSDDCGKLIYDTNKQEVNSGGSGCGCSASVFCGYIMEKLKKKELKNILLIGTGALLNTGTVLQNESIPGISHLVRITAED